MSFLDELIKVATEEWDWFGRDTGVTDKFIDPSTGQTTTARFTNGVANPRKETCPPYADRIGDYWLAISSDEYQKLVDKFAAGMGKLDGTIDLAWSAAFISYCMQKAGASDAFPYSGSHVTWINQAIRNRLANKTDANLVGYRVGETTLFHGDLVGRAREAGVTYDNATSKGWYKSHTEIIVEIDFLNRKAWAIGGNVGQSVSKTEFPIAEDGGLSPSSGWMVHIRNNITVEPAPVLPFAQALVG